MSSPNVTLLGAHRLKLSSDEFNAIVDYELETRFRRITEDQRDAAEFHIIDELTGVALIEALVTERDESFKMRDFAQGSQAAFGEVFLNDDGSKVISDSYYPPAGETLRLAFFMYYYSEGEPIATSYGDVVAPPITEMPERLSSLVKYESPM
jgi:hypothetical protein